MKIKCPNCGYEYETEKPSGKLDIHSCSLELRGHLVKILTMVNKQDQQPTTGIICNTARSHDKVLMDIGKLITDIV